VITARREYAPLGVLAIAALVDRRARPSGPRNNTIRAREADTTALTPLLALLTAHTIATQADLARLPSTCGARRSVIRTGEYGQLARRGGTSGPCYGASRAGHRC